MADNPVFDFLCREENLQVALEVAKQVNDFRPFLHRRFWADFEKALKNRLQQSPYADQWSISINGALEKDYCNIVIKPNPIATGYQGSYISVGLQQGSKDSNFELSYGLIWNKGDRPDPQGPNFRKLLEISKKAGFSDRYRNNWWPACRYLNIALRSDDFILQYGPHPEAAINSLIDTVWTYFELIEPTLSLVNQDLLQEK